MASQMQHTGGAASSANRTLGDTAGSSATQGLETQKTNVHAGAATAGSRATSASAKPKLNYKYLLKQCIELIAAFDTKKTTIDGHYSDNEHLLKGDAVTKKFCQQVFYTCMRYQKFLKLFVNAFLYKNPASAPRTDQGVYMVLGSLLFFRAEELGGRVGRGKTG